ncbi:hypothetical protein HZA97_04570 [Candidatus Woesearchaeota archaeon]|nr:hypothetical protein [Candidatus Woesearchaeota archaeon]
MSIMYQLFGIPRTVEEKASVLYQKARKRGYELVDLKVKRFNWTSLKNAVDVANELTVRGLEATVEGVPVAKISQKVDGLMSYVAQVYGDKELNSSRPQSLVRVKDSQGGSGEVDLGRVLDSAWDREMWRQARDIAFGA